MRKLLRLSTLLLLASFWGSASYSQDFSNKGKEFWLAYSYHVGMNGNNPTMTLYLTSDVTTTYTVEIFGVTTLSTGTINANQVVPVVVPNTYFINGDGTFNGRAVRVTAVKPIVVYSFITRNQASAATLCLPLNVLGKEYYATSFTQVSNENNSNSFVTIVGVEDNTSIEITPTANTVGGWLANSTHTITLNKGQVYQVLGTVSGNSGVDLTGTHVQSVASGSGGCKRIAVFSGSGKVSIGTPGCNGGSADNLYQQVYPVAAWGRKYVTAPSVNKPNNYYRIQRSSPTANVYLNGSLIPAFSFLNNYFEFYNNTPNVIESDTLISVAQYFTSQGCPTGFGGNPSPYDPDMIILNPVEQNINKVTLVNSPLTVTGAQQHNIHAVIRKGGTAQSSFTLDGAPIPIGNWLNHPNDPNYAYLYMANVAQGNHTIYSDSGFNAIAYGYGNAETYGYSAGTNVKDIYQFMSVQNQNATVNFPATCKNAPFYFSMTFPYQPTSLQWVFGTALNALGIADVNVPAPTPTSTTTVNGKTLYVYKLPNPYTISTVGTYPIKVIATNPTADGCGGVQEIDFDLQVFNPPVADFNFLTDGCVTNPVQFGDNSTTDFRPIIARYWNFGDATTSTLNGPSHTYAGPGAYTVKYAITTDVGCISDTASKVVTINNPPVAQFSVSSPNCPDVDITFTDQSTSTAGNLTQWTWDFGDGSPVVIRNSSTNETHRFATAGTYNVTLKVVTSSGCQSLVFTQPVTINPNPLAGFNLPVACLPAGAAQFNDLSTVTGGTITGWNWNFGDAATSNAQNPLHNYTTAGPFTVSLTVTSNKGCTDTRTQQLTTVYAEPVAAFNSLPEVCIGSLIGFSDASTAAGSIVNGWTWDFGDGSPLSTLQNPTHTYATAGTYTVSLRVSTLAGCQTVNNVATRTVVVKPLPTAAITGNTTVCLNAPSPFVTFTGASGSAPFHFSFSLNGGPTQVAIANTGNSVTVPVPTNAAGTFTYTLQSVQETATTGCVQAQTGTVVVNVKPLPTATFSSGNIAVCRNAPAQQITFTAANGTAPYTFEYNINGGATQTIVAATGNSVNLSVPTGTAGTFTYNLLSVKEGSANGCSQNVTSSLVVTVNELPTATIAGTTEVCLNAPAPNVTFTGAAGVAPYTFTYTINGGANLVVTSTGNSVTVPVPTSTAGTFVYALVDVKDASATTCSQTQTGSATIVVNPLPTANFNVVLPACETRLINFTDASVANAGNLSTWQWTFGDPASGAADASALQNPSHTYAVTGTYNVTLITSSDKGCVSAPFTRPVVINARPKAGFISPEVCLTDPNAPFIDTSRVAGGTITGWQWNFGDPNANAGNPNTAVTQNPTHWYTVVGPYMAQLIVTSNSGCTDTVRQSFTVNGSIPVAGFTVQNANALCSNKDVTITDASTVDFGSVIKVEIYWDYLNNPGVKTTDDSPLPGKTYTHTYPEFGTPFTQTYQVRYVAYSGINCVNTSIKTITVLATPTIQFNTIPFACTAQPAFQITQASLLNGIPGAGVFSGNGVTAAGLFTPSTGAGQYTIRYTYTGTNGCSNYKEQVLDIFATPAVNAGPDKFVLEGGQVTLTPALNANVPVTYQWTPPTGLDNATASFPKASPTSDITYTLTVTSPQGCSASDAVFVKVLKAPSVPNIFSPNGDGVHDRWVIPYLESYPGCTIDVVNRYGQPVFHSVGYATPWDGKINGKDAPVGTYYYVIDPKNGRSRMAGYVDIIR
jgi:gliding motility-associated-like protein